MEASPEEVTTILGEYSLATRAIYKEVFDITFFMRSLSRDEAWRLVPKEREAIRKRIEKNIEQTEKTGLALL